MNLSCISEQESERNHACQSGRPVLASPCHRRSQVKEPAIKNMLLQNGAFIYCKLRGQF